MKVYEYVLKFKEDAVKKLKRISGMSDQTKKKTESLTGSFDGLGKKIAGAFTVASVLAFGHMVGQTIREVEGAQNRLRATTQLTGNELARTNAKALAISDTLGVNNDELVNSANILSREYKDAGVDMDAALSLIKTGIQATGGNFDLNEVKEYTTQVKQAGLSAEQFIALSAQAKKQGFYDDKALDTVKEFRLRIQEMTPAAKEALKGIGLSGGKILKKLDDGSLDTVEAMKQVTKAMKGADTQARQTAIADLFGGPGEDVGARFFANFAQMDLSIQGMTKGMEGVVGHQNKIISHTEKMRILQAKLATSVKPMMQQWDLFKVQAQEVLWDVLLKGLHFVQQNSDLIIKRLKQIGTVAAVFLTYRTYVFAAAKAQLFLSKAVKMARLATILFTGGFAKLNAVMNLNPIGLIVMGIAALVIGVIYAYNEFESFRGAVHGVWQAMKEFGIIIKEMVVDRFQKLLSGLTGIGQALWKLFKRDWKGAFETGKQAITDLVQANPFTQVIKNAKSGAKRIRGAFEQGFEEGVKKKPIELPFAGMLTGQTAADGLLADAGAGAGAEGAGAGLSDDTQMDASLRDTSENISSGGSKVINISVEVAKLVGIENVNTTTIRENAQNAAEEVRKEINKILNGGVHVAGA